MWVWVPAAGICPVTDTATLSTADGARTFSPALDTLLDSSGDGSTNMLAGYCTLLPQGAQLIFNFSSAQSLLGMQVTVAQGYGSKGIIATLINNATVSL